jgi:hypothetical protein
MPGCAGSIFPSGMNESIGHSLRLRERADGSETIMKDYVRIEVCLLLQPGREAYCAVLLLPFGTDDIKPLFFRVATAPEEQSN